jgi:transposase
METIKVITGVERRRKFTAQEKQALVEEGLEPGNSFSAVARKHGISPSLIFNWRRRMKEGQIAAIQADDAVVPLSELKRAQAEIKQLQRLVGKQAMHLEVLKEAVTLGREKKLISRAPLSGIEGFE